MKTYPIFDKIPLVLVVDDDRAMRGLLKVAIESQGYQVIDAKNGEECLNKYGQFQPDMVLLDAIMPDMDGFTCCQQLRSLPDTHYLPILMITALDDQESIERAFAVGATDYITKPIYWTVLSQRVNYLLSTSQALKQLDHLKLQGDRQEKWQQLSQKMTQKLQHPFEIKSLLKDSLGELRNLVDAERVGLYQGQGSLVVEIIKKGYPSVKSLSWDKITLFENYRTSYQNDEMVIIELSESLNLPGDALECFEQLTIQTAMMLPILKEGEIWGILWIHHCQNTYIWESWEKERLSCVADLLAIAVSVIDFRSR
ncbi:response regulator receiver modulated GAF sensor protein [Rippkaea orientalis PCC 8801]|uniref:Response regulator receiver modulated GAF sensor protein n=1 Tax=Rippkaea orientalis (strain PCC 8801 / RF-1) TaxID=41431 RepID=B7JUI7_RIPO1|nr:response regulator [Rippkaea orientalis]ACK65531.1 response regulator receiver modulated GAF sensor protein [Rippkaea orientalis PCC 8801]